MRHTDTGRRPWDPRGGDKKDAATSQGTPGPPGLGGDEGSYLELPGGWACPHPDFTFQPPELEEKERLLV